MKQRKITLQSDNLKLLGEIYFPKNQKQPCPALILCHGIPAAKHDPTDRGYT
jgi:hypothetical protein